MGIPKIIHQIWFDFSKDGSGKNPPKKYLVNRDMCRQINKDWNFILWDEELCLNLIKTRYPEYLDMYINYEYPIQRVDAARYFILHAFGGVYMDMDMICRKPLKFDEDGVFLVQVNMVSKFNNAFIASSPNEPFWNVLFEILKESSQYGSTAVKNLNSKFLTVFNTTGPFMLDKTVKKYDGNKLKILNKNLYQSCDMCGNISDDDYYVIHYSDRNWTTNFEDTIVNVWCQKYYILLIIVSILCIAGIIYASIKLK